MKAQVLSSAVACLCFWTGCSPDRPAPAKPASSETAPGSPLTAPVDYVGAVGQAQKSARSTLGTLGLEQAIRAFQAEHGRFPGKLEELVESGTVPALPAPPAGKRFDYQPATGSVKVVPR